MEFRTRRSRAGERLAYRQFLRHLEALLLLLNKEQTFLLSGQGDVIEPDGGIAAIGSGAPYAQAQRKPWQSTASFRLARSPRKHEDCRQNVHLHK